MDAKKFWTAVAGVILIVACFTLFRILILEWIGMLESVHDGAKAQIFLASLLSTGLVATALVLKVAKLNVPLWVYVTLLTTVPMGTAVIVSALLIPILRP